MTTTHAARRLRGRAGFHAAVGLRTWESHELVKDGWTLAVTAMPGVHSTRAPLRALLPPVMGSLLELRDAASAVVARTYVTGDTMLFEGIDEIALRYPDLDAAVVHLGGTTLPGGFVVTMTGRDGIELLRRVRPRVAVPVHLDDYGVFKSGRDDLETARRDAELATEIRYVDRGATVALPTRTAAD